MIFVGFMKKGNLSALRSPRKGIEVGWKKSKEVFGSLQEGNGWQKGIKRSLWFPS
jgi:hypothetical protein